MSESYHPINRPISPTSSDGLVGMSQLDDLDAQMLSDLDPVLSEQPYQDSSGFRSPSPSSILLQNDFAPMAAVASFHHIQRTAESDPIADALNAEQIFVHPGLGFNPPFMGPPGGITSNSSSGHYNGTDVQSDMAPTPDTNRWMDPPRLTTPAPFRNTFLPFAPPNNVSLKKADNNYFTTRLKGGPKPKKDIYGDRLLEHASNATTLPPIPALNLALLSRGKTLKYERPWVPGRTSDGGDGGGGSVDVLEKNMGTSDDAEKLDEAEFFKANRIASDDQSLPSASDPNPHSSSSINHSVNNRFVTPMPISIGPRLPIGLEQPQKTILQDSAFSAPLSSSSLDAQSHVPFNLSSHTRSSSYNTNTSTNPYSAQPPALFPSSSSDHQYHDKIPNLTRNEWMEFESAPNLDLNVDMDDDVASGLPPSGHPLTNRIAPPPLQSLVYEEDGSIRRYEIPESRTEARGVSYDMNLEEEFDEGVLDGLGARDGSAYWKLSEHAGSHMDAELQKGNEMHPTSETSEDIQYTKPFHTFGIRQRDDDDPDFPPDHSDRNPSHLAGLTFSRRLMDKALNDVNGTSSPAIKYLTPIPASPGTSNSSPKPNDGFPQTPPPTAPSPATSHDSIESWTNDDVLAYLKGEFEGKRKKDQG